MAANYYKYNANMNDRTYFTSVIVDTAGNAKRYFSNVESEIYFGDREMDDLYQFEFGIDEKVLPIYGYNCYYATEIVNGQRIIQGQFVVNYTDTKLIQNTLSSIDDSIYNQIYNEDYSAYHYVQVPLEENPYICIFLGTISNNIRSTLSDAYLVDLNKIFIKDFGKDRS